MARGVRERLRKLRKKKPANAGEVAVAIRTARLERARVTDATRERLAIEDAEQKTQKTLLKLAEEKRKIAWSEKCKTSNEAKMVEPRRKMQALTAEAKKAKKARDDLDIARSYADEVYEKLKALTPSQKTEMFAAADRRAVQVKAGACILPRHVPDAGQPVPIRRHCGRSVKTCRNIRNA